MRIPCRGRRPRRPANVQITIAGNLVVDNIKTIDVYSKRSMLSNILDVERCAGGCATNTIVHLAKIDGDIPLKVWSGGK